MTGICVFILTGLSVFMAPILKVSTGAGFSSSPSSGSLGRRLKAHLSLSSRQFIPMPVLYGVFLYMGVASLNGVQVDFPSPPRVRSARRT